jgi:hypothetical protein
MSTRGAAHRSDTTTGKWGTQIIMHEKKRKRNFPHIQYKKIEMGSVAKSYMKKGFPIYAQIFNHI